MHDGKSLWDLTWPTWSFLWMGCRCDGAVQCEIESRGRVSVSLKGGLFPWHSETVVLADSQQFSSKTVWLFRRLSASDHDNDQIEISPAGKGPQWLTKWLIWVWCTVLMTGMICTMRYWLHPVGKSDRIYCGQRQAQWCIRDQGLSNHQAVSWRAWIQMEAVDSPLRSDLRFHQTFVLFRGVIVWMNGVLYLIFWC